MLDPKYVDQIIRCDCVEGIRNLPDLSIPATVTSPPYDGLREYGAPSFTFAKFKELAQEFYRVTMQGGVVAWVVQDGVTEGGISGTSHRQAAWFQDIGFRLHDEIVVQKKGKRGGGIVRYPRFFIRARADLIPFSYSGFVAMWSLIAFLAFSRSSWWVAK